MDALRLAFVRLDLTMPGMTAVSLSRGARRQPDRVMPLYAGKVHVGQLSLAADRAWSRSAAPTSDCLMLLVTYLPAAHTTSVCNTPYEEPWPRP